MLKMAHNYKTSDLITPAEADYHGLSVFYWNTRKSMVSGEAEVAKELKKEKQMVHNMMQKREARRLTRVSSVGMQGVFNAMPLK